MGRKSALTDDQWAEVDKRVVEGEEVRSIARDFGVTEACIRMRLKRHGKKPTVQKVAKLIIEAEAAFEQLPAGAQVATRKLVDRLRSISESVCDAAELSAKTSHRLMALANEQVNKVDDADPLGEASVATLRNVGVLTKMGNESAHISLNVIAANREVIKRGAEEEPPDASQELTPERMAEGARRLAFTLRRAAHLTETT